MTRFINTLLCVALLTSTFTSHASEDGFESIFNGQTLEGWDGNPDFWSVKDGAITGITTPENPTKGNTFIVWRNGQLGDFELRLQFRIVGGNSGVQYRSKEVSKWVVAGYQADFDGSGAWTGTLYEERGRGVLAKRGNKVVIGKNGEKQNAGNTATEQEILEAVKKEDWNDYTIIAKGNHLIQILNGKVTIDVVDHQQDRAAVSGLLALQLHAGPPMTVQFKDIRVKDLSAPKKIAFMAGTRSHGYGSHEHFAGSMILANSIREHMPGYTVDVFQNGWPKDANAFADADCIVMYCDGGSRHPVNANLAQIDALAKKGVGVVCIHYGVEVPKGDSGDHFLKWIGGYFETHWSVNPHWTARFDHLPVHPITRGVKPFEVNDEWYYHMRFRPAMKGVTPILSAMPPKTTLTRPDGPHSGNPHVRASVAAGNLQHVAWAAERADGGRGFGFTGGHNHWNWGDDNFRKVVLNAIVWCAKGEVPTDGVPDDSVTYKELEQNQDFDQPGNFNKLDVIRKFNLKLGSAKRREPVKPLFRSKLITTDTPNYSVPVKVDLKGAEQLVLVVEDGGDGFGCDWANWENPIVRGEGWQKSLTDLQWKSASSEWGRVNVNKNADGKPLRSKGRQIKLGIGTHSNSTIVYDLPEGALTFEAVGCLDEGGTQQADGKSTSVIFAVYNQMPTVSANSGLERHPELATSGLAVGTGMEATLAASEPKLFSLTNLDIDHRGRVWVCEVMNYRKHANRRPEGDRILILEDTDKDGVMDEQKVFYQGRDVDSAMGICVLGNKVIVSATPKVLIFTDDDGDDVPDSKVVLFDKTGQPQHDHSVHSFVFGPDGKLYWNFGNTGKAVYDAGGELVKDLTGNDVVDNGKPYYGGMIFRCDMDGTNFEVLAHNFRNNYEVAVDSFGRMWQSDNDDDGNKGVRINYILEYGNYGYRDELTGAGWRAERTGMAEQIPLRHWHLNDPGVVPNLLQTGAGSPTGIAIYEGSLLPSRLHNEVIHCDAGPNIVRAYPVEKSGAGFTASIDNVVEGIDKWFRPADVCVAPDGSIFITDWYDPGVGGHNMQDLERGRLFRVAPVDSKYDFPKVDVTTINGAIAALRSPNLSTRYLGWTALRKFGEGAESALLDLFHSDIPRERARALWLLAKIPGKAEQYVETAAKDRDEDIRATALRIARQADLDLVAIVSHLVADPSAQVRREALIALRFIDSPKADQLWAKLAALHDGKDRWYLETLGIAADLHWESRFEAWLKLTGNNWNTAAGRDIVWRSRSKKAPAMLATILLDKATKESEQARYLRAFDYHSGPEKEQALETILLGM
ncbi:MAG: PVC-type heme-binding CxxCH protein [Planctomycetaceae bacterium]